MSGEEIQDARSNRMLVPAALAGVAMTCSLPVVLKQISGHRGGRDTHFV
jgi:hypothetical protein